MNKIEKLLLVHGSDIIFVGIDVAKKNHYARIINHIGLTCWPLKRIGLKHTTC